MISPRWKERRRILRRHQQKLHPSLIFRVCIAFKHNRWKCKKEMGKRSPQSTETGKNKNEDS